MAARKNPVTKLKAGAKKKPPVKRKAAPKRKAKSRIKQCAEDLGRRGGKATAKKKAAPRKKNPARGSTLQRAINQAVRLYESFTGHKANKFLKEVRVSIPKVGILVGTVDGVLYTTVRDGKTEKYIHEFKKSARPMLVSSSGGRQLFFLGGNYTFTHRGIVDN